MDKIISIWKPEDITSYDVVRKVKKYIKNEKIGHCGTLDPFAEGILVLCIGASTKKVSKIMDCKKIYKTTILLGEETDTLDLTGTVIKSSNKKVSLNKELIESVISRYVGDYKQIPPYYSAKKIYGVKLYDLARRNIFIRRKPNIVKIFNIELDYWKNNEIQLTIECGKGTYIRSLTRDISYGLNTYGYVQNLKRIKVGDYTKSNSYNYNNLENVIAT